MFLAACLLCYKPATILSSQHSARPCQARGEGAVVRERGALCTSCAPTGERLQAPAPARSWSRVRLRAPALARSPLSSQPALLPAIHMRALPAHTKVYNQDSDGKEKSNISR